LRSKRIDFPKQKKLVLYSGLSGGFMHQMPLKPTVTAIVKTSQGKIIMNETVKKKLLALIAKQVK
jgi:hypothetical protein